MISIARTAEFSRAREIKSRRIDLRDGVDHASEAWRGARFREALALEAADLGTCARAWGTTEGHGRNYEQMRGPSAEQFVAGAGAATIVGSPEQVAKQLGQISETGMEGVMLGFLSWNEEREYFGLHDLPLLQQMGLRSASATFSSGSLKGDPWPTTSS